MTTTTIHIDATTGVQVTDHPAGQALELAGTSSRVRIIAPAGWDLARIAALTLEELTEPPDHLQL